MDLKRKPFEIKKLSEAIISFNLSCWTLQSSVLEGSLRRPWNDNPTNDYTEGDEGQRKKETIRCPFARSRADLD